MSSSIIEFEDQRSKLVTNMNVLAQARVVASKRGLISSPMTDDLYNSDSISYSDRFFSQYSCPIL